MKTTRNISGTYERPEAEEIILKMENPICELSGGSTDDVDDEEVNP